MNEIVKENYESSHLIHKVIEGLPDYIILNQELKTMFKETYEYFMEEKVFSIDCLVSIFEYFEALCWKEINGNILLDYKLEVSNETKKYITEYFKNIKNDEKKLIKVNNFTAALRKLISRSLAGSRQDIDIKFDAKLILYINRDDLWPKEFLNEEKNDEFVNELYMICKDDLIIGNCLDLYNCLDGDNIKKMIIKLMTKMKMIMVGIIWMMKNKMKKGMMKIMKIMDLMMNMMKEKMKSKIKSD